MFTGIIEERAVVEKFDHKENLSVLTVKAGKIMAGTKVADSVCVNGVCLTVTAKRSGLLSFDLMKETLDVTTFKTLKTGDYVNLERAMKADSRFGGHFVTGHVDGIGTIRRIVTLPNYVEFQIASPRKFMRYLVTKGSVCLDGVSLTVGRVKGNLFSVYLIPLTLQVTNLGLKKAGDLLNIETDIIARYILRRT